MTNVNLIFNGHVNKLLGDFYSCFDIVSACQLSRDAGRQAVASSVFAVGIVKVAG